MSVYDISVIESNIYMCIRKAWSATDRLMTIWKPYIADQIERELFKPVFISVLLYGCTTWTIRKR